MSNDSKHEKGHQKAGKESPAFDPRRPKVAEVVVTFPVSRASEELTPREELDVAGDLHRLAEQYARNAHRRASEEGVALGSVADPEPLKPISTPAETAVCNLGVEHEILMARRWLGIPDQSKVSEVEVAIREFDESKKQQRPAREVISLVGSAAMAAEESSETLPGMQTVAWLLSKATRLARLAFVKRFGNFVYDERSENLLQRCVDNIRAVDPKIGQRDAIRRILAVTDADDYPHRFARLITKLEDRIRKAKKADRAAKARPPQG